MKEWIKYLALLVGLTLHVTALGQSTNFAPMVPVRLLDTRSNGSTVDGQAQGAGPISTRTAITLNVWGRAGIPSGAKAVSLNVTVMNATAAGYITVWATGEARPNASNLNFAQGVAISNQVIAKVSPSGQVSLYVYAGPSGNAQVIADVAGYFPAAADLVPLTPARLLDTRPSPVGSTIDGQLLGGGAFGTGETRSLTVLGRGGVPPSGVSAVMLNVTATGPTTAGYLAAWPSGASRPNASNVNFLAGQTIPNLVIVALGQVDGLISLYNGPGSTDVVVDVVGYFTSTATLSPVVPARLMDTRPNSHTVDGISQGEGAFIGPVTRNLTVTGRGGVPNSGVGAVVLNLTAVTPTAAGYLTAWGTGTTTQNPPGVWDVNYSAGSVIAGLVIAQVGPNGQISIYSSAGSTDVIADVVGWLPAANTGSVFVSLSADVLVNGTDQILNSQTIYLANPEWVYVQSDGRYFSETMPTGGRASVYLSIDGTKISNDSTIDWSGSNNAMQHTFNAIGAAYLNTGLHVINFVASGQQFNVGAGSNLSILVKPATNVVVSTIQSQLGPYSFSLSSSQLSGASPLPNSVVLQNNISAASGTPIFSKASFSEQNDGVPSHGGDVLSTIYYNGNEPTLSQATWTNNDGFAGIELTAPMYSQSYYSAGSSNSISLNTSLYPWIINGNTNPVQYYLLPSGKLISLYGGMQVYGASNSSALSASQLSSQNVGSFICLGSSQGYSGCPNAGTGVLLTSKTINIPAGHSGEVLFMSKIRMQGDSSDGGGMVVLYISIDGVSQPTVGIQGVTSFDGASQRTISTSYLSAGDKRLSVGTHNIQVWASAQGQFLHMTTSTDVPLVYFD